MFNREFFMLVGRPSDWPLPATVDRAVERATLCTFVHTGRPGGRFVHTGRPGGRFVHTGRPGGRPALLLVWYKLRSRAVLAPFGFRSLHYISWWFFKKKLSIQFFSLPTTILQLLLFLVSFSVVFSQLLGEYLFNMTTYSCLKLNKEKCDWFGSPIGFVLLVS